MCHGIAQSHKRIIVLRKCKNAVRSRNGVPDSAHTKQRNALFLNVVHVMILCGYVNML